jgi:hypothetical protein
MQAGRRGAALAVASYAILAASAVLAILAASAAVAQGGPEAAEATTLERQSVFMRSRPDYDALPLRWGDFLATPALDVKEAYDSNVYVTPSSPDADLVSTLHGNLALKSDWNVHSLGLAVDTTVTRYLSRVSENRTDTTFTGDGRLDILYDVYLAGTLSYQLLHEPRSSPDSVTNEKSPIAYQKVSGTFTFLRDPGRLGLKLDGAVDNYNYDNGVTDTGVLISETDRNRSEYVLTPRVTYEIAPGYHAFLKVPLNARIYADSNEASTALNRNSNGYEVDIGTAIDLGHLISSELFVGQLHQDYDSSQFRTLSGVSFGASALWNPTEQASLQLRVLHLVTETTLPGASADLQTVVSPSVEYELRRNLLVGAGLTYLVDSFEGTNRVDHSYDTNLSLRYLLNRNISIDLKGIYSWRQSDAPLTNYSQNVISATLRLQD